MSDLLEDACLELLLSGWQINGPSMMPVPVSVVSAYTASGFDQAILDETRHLCGKLRTTYKHSKEHQGYLEDLRKGLAQARKVKEKRCMSQ